MHPALASMRLEVDCAEHRLTGREWGGKDYSDDVSRLYWAESKGGIVRHHGRTFRLGPDRLLLVPAGTVFDYQCSGSFLQHWVHFRALSFGGLDLLRYLGCRYEVAVDDRARVAAQFERLESVAEHDTPPAVVEANGLLLQMIAPFLQTPDRAVQKRQGDGLMRFKEVLAFIEEHLGERLRVSALASVAHLERTYFSRAFEKHFGVTPARFIQQQRLDRARRMLLETDLKLRVIGERIGYCDVYHFSRTFKKLSGITPSAFRREATRLP